MENKTINKIKDLSILLKDYNIEEVSLKITNDEVVEFKEYLYNNSPFKEFNSKTDIVKGDSKSLSIRVPNVSFLIKLTYE